MRRNRGEDMGRPKKWTKQKIEEVRHALEEYTNNTDIPILVEFAYQSGVTRQRLYEFAGENQAFSDTIRKCLEKKEAVLEKKALTKEVNHSMAIFSLKQMGWRDTPKEEDQGAEALNKLVEAIEQNINVQSETKGSSN